MKPCAWNGVCSQGRSSSATYMPGCNRLQSTGTRCAGNTPAIFFLFLLRPAHSNSRQAVRNCDRPHGLARRIVLRGAGIRRLWSIERCQGLQVNRDCAPVVAPSVDSVLSSITSLIDEPAKSPSGSMPSSRNRSMSSMVHRPIPLSRSWRIFGIFSPSGPSGLPANSSAASRAPRRLRGVWHSPQWPRWRTR